MRLEIKCPDCRQPVETHQKPGGRMVSYCPRCEKILAEQK